MLVIAFGWSRMDSFVATTVVTGQGRAFWCRRLAGERISHMVLRQQIAASRRRSFGVADQISRWSACHFLTLGIVLANERTDVRHVGLAVERCY